MIKNILHPNRYHGFKMKAPFFEGWYYKLVSADEKRKFAIIPGVYIAPESRNSHCFVQVFDSEADEVQYHRYPYEAFKANADSFEIKVDSNVFTAERIELSINDDLGQLRGKLRFSGLNPWPVKFFSPGAMGWFSWVPRMETYHGVVSMDHYIDGQLIANGETNDFSGGHGYIEKDWGKRFPSAWIWGQSNHFEQRGVSVMISTAVVPWLGWSFAGFIIGMLHDGQLYRFTTYNRSKIQSISIEDDSVDLLVENSTHRLHILARKAKGGILQAPTLVEMDRRIIETIDATLEVRLEKRDGVVIYEGLGRHAGLEIMGDMDKLTKII